MPEENKLDLKTVVAKVQHPDCYACRRRDIEKVVQYTSRTGGARIELCLDCLLAGVEKLGAKGLIQ